MGYYFHFAGNDVLAQDTLYNALIEEGAQVIPEDLGRFPRELFYLGAPIWFFDAERVVRSGELAVARLSWASSPETVAELTRSLLSICERLGLDSYADGLDTVLRPENLGDVLAQFSDGAKWALEIFPPVRIPNSD